MEEVRGASFAKLKILFGSTVVDTTSMCFQLNALNPPPPCLGRERAAVDVDVGLLPGGCAVVCYCIGERLKLKG